MGRTRNIGSRLLDQPQRPIIDIGLHLQIRTGKRKPARNDPIELGQRPLERRVAVIVPIDIEADAQRPVARNPQWARNGLAVYHLYLRALVKRALLFAQFAESIDADFSISASPPVATVIPWTAEQVGAQAHRIETCGESCASNLSSPGRCTTIKVAANMTKTTALSVPIAQASARRARPRLPDGSKKTGLPFIGGRAVGSHFADSSTPGDSALRASRPRVPAPQRRSSDLT